MSSGKLMSLEAFIDMLECQEKEYKEKIESLNKFISDNPNDARAKKKLKMYQDLLYATRCDLKISRRNQELLSIYNNEKLVNPDLEEF